MVTRVLQEFPGFEYSTKSGGAAQQFNFIVQVESKGEGLPVPTLDNQEPQEHQDYRWVGPEDSLEDFEGKMTDSMAEVIRQALSVIGVEET